MANKYIRHGAAFNGDGTSPDLATADGGVGAWNTITYFENIAPAYGSIAAGDVVYIRSKDELGVDITRTLTVNRNIGIAGLTSASKGVTWILDDGTMWTGIDGILTYLSTGTMFGCVLQAYNELISARQSALVFTNTSANPGDARFLLSMGVPSICRNCKFDYSSANNIHNRVAAVLLSNGSIIENPQVKVGKVGVSGYLIFGANFNGKATIINPDIELVTTSYCPLFMLDANYIAEYTVIGGRIYGIGATTGAYLVRDLNARLQPIFIGFKYPAAMSPTIYQYGKNSYTATELIDCDEFGGSWTETPWGYYTSRTDNFPPTLSSALPDSTNTPWAFRVYPQLASYEAPVRIPLSKMVTDVASIKTIALELLVGDSVDWIGQRNKETVWVSLVYTDALTGLPVSLTSKDYSGNDLETSNANWTFTSWGMTNCLKRKITLVTPTSVKQNSIINLVFFSIQKSGTANDIYFVDPDFGVN